MLIKIDRVFTCFEFLSVFWKGFTLANATTSSKAESFTNLADEYDSEIDTIDSKHVGVVEVDEEDVEDDSMKRENKIFPSIESFEALLTHFDKCKSSSKAANDG